MNWDEWSDEVFENIIAGLKHTNPVTEAAEWQLFWQMLGFWKSFRETKAKEQHKHEN